MAVTPHAHLYEISRSELFDGFEFRLDHIKNLFVVELERQEMPVANDAAVGQPYDLGVRAPRRQQVGCSLFDSACMRRIFIAGDKTNMFSLKAICLFDNRHAWHDARALQYHERRDPGEASTH